MSSRAIASTIGALLVIAGGSTVATAVCSFPWTVTATAVPGGIAAVSICGVYAGCFPHNRQTVVIGNEIRVTYTQAELPDCLCVTINDEFRDSVLISAAPGHYTVTVTVLSCGQSMSAGSTEFTMSASTAIPMLDIRGMLALIALIAIVAIWRLRA